MSAITVGKELEVQEEQGLTVIQYWICVAVDIFRLGQHVYEISGKKYVVMAYCSDKRIALGMCATDRIIAIMEVHNYKIEDRLAHKKNWTFLAWILPSKRKRLR